jgi:hypothetical protein
MAIGIGAIGLVGHAAATRATALNHVPPARAPCRVLSGQPCHPSFCSVFQHGSCFPEYPVPFGGTLRLTIVSTDDSDTGAKPKPVAQSAGGDNGADGNATDGRELNTIRDMFAALRGCWMPPPKDEARHGMEYTIRFAFKRDGAMIAPPCMTYASHDAPSEVRDVYRDAIDGALKRRVPLRFSEAMGEAVAGHPIAIRFVDDRTIDQDSGK